MRTLASKPRCPYCQGALLHYNGIQTWSTPALALFTCLARACKPHTFAVVVLAALALAGCGGIVAGADTETLREPASDAGPPCIVGLTRPCDPPRAGWASMCGHMDPPVWNACALEAHP